MKKLKTILSHLALRQQLVLAGLVVGVTSGASAYLLERLIALFSWISTGFGGNMSDQFVKWVLLLMPAVGGLIAGIITHKFCHEAKGHGLDEVISAINDRQGLIDGHVFWAKSIASAATVGTGGSAGSEGPIIQIGASVGSLMGRIMRINSEDLKTLVAAGATGGLAAAFSIPLAGVFFTMEVILKNFANEAFPAVVISSVTGAVTSRFLIGSAPIFMASHYQWQSPVEFLYYACLGLLCAPTGVFYRRAIEKSEDLFHELTAIPDWVRPAIGGLVVGLITIFLPQVRGPGAAVINKLLTGQIVGGILVALLLGKIIATCFTLGSGGSGGWLLPSLFVGAALGALFGWALGSVHPLPIALGAMAMVGMAGVFTASFEAPITAIVMTLEITRDYEILMPVMIGCVVSLIVAKQIYSTLAAPDDGNNPSDGR